MTVFAGVMGLRFEGTISESDPTGYDPRHRHVGIHAKRSLSRYRIHSGAGEMLPDLLKLFLDNIAVIESEEDNR